LLPGWKGGAAEGHWHHQRLSVHPGTEVLGTFADGSPALTHRSHGDGGAFLFATHADLAVKRNRAPRTEQLLQAIGEASGAQRLFEADRAPDGQRRISARLRRNGGRSIVTVTSSSDEPAEARVLIEAGSARDLVSGESLPVENGSVRVHLDARSARIVLLEETR
jgi:hypothetical protein